MEIQTSEIETENHKVKNYKKYYISAVLVVLAFFVGLRVGAGNGDFITNFGQGKEVVQQNQDRGPREVNWQLLWDTIAEIEKSYVDGPVNMQEVLYGAISGAVASLGDPYSVFFPPEQADEFQDELSGNLEGIGAEIAIKNQRLTVVSPLDGSPAESAGIRPGDFIWKVDDEETTELSIQQAVNKIRGEAGTQVKLTVFHPGSSSPLDITVTRAKIVVKSVESEILNENGREIGYIKMRRFGEDTSGMIQQAISDFLVADIDGLIIDVRNNPGGFLQSSIEIASNWVKDGMPVVIQKFGDGSEDVFRASGTARLSGIPTVVLINGGSASASEILSGALQDYNLATLVGETSFGKGSVQELVDLSDGSDLKLTIAKWLTPSGHNLNEAGLTPDIIVELTEEDFNADRDPQLDRAIEVLTQ